MTNYMTCGIGGDCDPEDPQKKFKDDLQLVVSEIVDLLIQKNAKYGDAVLSPLRVFSKANIDEQIRVRLDDKLSRIANRKDNEDEDVTLDLIGYLIMLRISELRLKGTLNADV